MTRAAVRVLSLVWAMVVATGCAPTSTYTPPIGTVVVAFATDTDNERWQAELDYLVLSLEAKNYTVITMNVADGDAKKMAEYVGQITPAQPSIMILESPDVASVELSTALESLVAQCQTKILCYDRLQQNTTAISGLITLPHQEMGRLEADALAALPGGAKVELLAGPLYDNTALPLFAGAYDGIEAQLASALWTIPSGADTYDKAKLNSWSKDAAYQRMLKLLDDYYPNQTLPAAVITGSDAQAAGVGEAIRYRYPNATLPIITGVGNTTASWVRIVNDKQTMTVAYNEQKLADTAIEILEQWHKGNAYSFEASSDNGKKIVPTAVVTPIKALYKKDFQK